MRATTLIFTTILLLVLACSAFADGDKAEVKEDLLTVSGKVKIFAPADRATVSFDLSGTGASLEKAFASVHAKTDTIVTQLKAIGLDQKNLHTSFFRSGENEGGKAFLSSKRDYKVSQNASVTTDKLDLLEQIVVILSRNEVERISNLFFELSDPDELKANAIKEATNLARNKAVNICTTLGVRLGKVKEVSEYGVGEIFIRGGRAGEVSYILDGVPIGDPLGGYNSVLREKGYGDSDYGLFGQEFSLEAQIKIVFEIDNGDKVKKPVSLGEL
jgi:hypothetical protein